MVWVWVPPSTNRTQQPQAGTIIAIAHTDKTHRQTPRDVCVVRAQLHAPHDLPIWIQSWSCLITNRIIVLYARQPPVCCLYLYCSLCSVFPVFCCERVWRAYLSRSTIDDSSGLFWVFCSVKLGDKHECFISILFVDFCGYRLEWNILSNTLGIGCQFRHTTVSLFIALQCAYSKLNCWCLWITRCVNHYKFVICGVICEQTIHRERASHHHTLTLGHIFSIRDTLRLARIHFVCVGRIQTPITIELCTIVQI